jgi:O-antigen/teichoic acid export membrane protein
MMKKLIEQNIYALITPLTVLASGLITSLLFTRILPTFEFGVYASLISFTLLLTSISDLGIPNTLMKIAGESFHSNSGHGGFYVRYLLKWKLVALVITSSALLLFSSQLAQLFLHSADFAYVMQVLAALVILYSINQFITNLFVTIGRFEYSSLISISLNGSRVIFPLILVLLLGPTLFAITVGLLFAFLLAAITSILFFVLKFKYELSYVPPKSMAEVNSFLFYSTILTWATFLSTNVDSIMLNYFSGPQELAYFGVSSSVVLMLVALLPISSNFLLSFLIQMQAKEELELQKRLFEKTLKYGLLFSIPLTFLVYLTANRIILFLWPPSYLPAAQALRILSLFIPFNFLGGLSTSLFMSKGKMRELTAITFISYLFTWGAGAYLISNYGLVGTALTFVLSNVFQAVVLLKLSMRILQMPFNFMYLVKPLLASLIIALFIIIVNSFMRSTVLLFLIAGALFAIVYLPLMDSDDKKLANTLLSFANVGPIFR